VKGQVAVAARRSKHGDFPCTFDGCSRVVQGELVWAPNSRQNTWHQPGVALRARLASEQPCGDAFTESTRKGRNFSTGRRLRPTSSPAAGAAVGQDRTRSQGWQAHAPEQLGGTPRCASGTYRFTDAGGERTKSLFGCGLGRSEHDEKLQGLGYRLESMARVGRHEGRRARPDVE
jgi:hypothetical protein